MKEERKPYRTVLKPGSGEIEVKKSRFIAEIDHVETEKEAERILAETKKKFPDATHSCYAFVLGKRGERLRFSDAGEPSGTAGKPMLDVLCGEKLTDSLAVVTRYFGGTLLGTGGLCRAYSEAVRTGLAAAKTGLMIPGVRLQIEVDYAMVGKILYCLQEEQIPVLSSSYTDVVSLTAAVPDEKRLSLRKRITDLTGGQAKITEGEESYFKKEDGTLAF